MPDELDVPTFVLTPEAVRWGIDGLGERPLHPTFVMYLYLRKQARAGKLDSASASSEELLSLIRMPGHPIKPYYFPLIDRGKREGKPLPTFWRARNIPGSWSPGSIRRQKVGGWLGASESAYRMPDDHVDLALTEMLDGRPVSAHALGAFFLRNDGFIISETPTALDVVDGLRAKFEYAEADDEFLRLFSTETPDVSFEWFELYNTPATQIDRERADA